MSCDDVVVKGFTNQRPNVAIFLFTSTQPLQASRYFTLLSKLLPIIDISCNTFMGSLVTNNKAL